MEIKVLIVSANPFIRNGVSNVIFNYLGSMDMSDMTIDVVSMNTPDESYNKILREKNSKCFIIPRSKTSILKRWYYIFKLLKKNKYDAIHMHANSHTCIMELSAAWAAGCKVRIVHSHSTKCISPLLHKILSPLFYHLCTHGIACGKEAGLWMFAKKPFLIMKNGINTEAYRYKPEQRNKYREKLEFAEDNIVIGHVGNFYNVKNHSFLINVFSVLHNNNPFYKLLLIGDGKMRNDIESQISSLGLKNDVVLTGGVADVYNYLNAIDAVVMPSLFEGLPLSLVEQQANGLQCVVSDTVSSEADLTGNICFLSLNTSADGWATKVNELIDLKNRKERSETSIKQIEDKGYSIQKEASKLKDYYHKAILEQQ